MEKMSLCYFTKHIIEKCTADEMTVGYVWVV